jgi:hypothetical protein
MEAGKHVYCAVAHKSALAGGEVLEVPDWGDGPRE